VKRRPKAGVDKSCLARGGIFVSFVFFVIFVCLSRRRVQ